MFLNNTCSSSRFRHGAAMFALLLLGACTDTGAGAAGASGATGADGGKSYRLVIQLRPENIVRYFAPQHAAYDLCVTNAKGLHLPIKPFPNIPADFVHDRHVYISDGKRFFIKEMQYLMIYDTLSPQQGCEAKLVMRSNSTLIADGKSRTASQEPDGSIAVDEAQPDTSEPLAAGRLTDYRVAKTVKGVALKCTVKDQCIIDPALAQVTDGQHPVHVTYRLDERDFGTAMVGELVSFSVGAPVDPAEMRLGEVK
jgi:hypothetical protein